MDVVKTQNTLLFNNYVEINEQKISMCRYGGVYISGLTFNAKSKLPIFSNEDIGNMIAMLLNSEYREKLNKLTISIREAICATSEYEKYVSKYSEQLESISPLLRLFSENLFLEEFIFQIIENKRSSSKDSITIADLSVSIIENVSHFTEYLNIDAYIESFISEYIKSMFNATISPVTKLLNSLDLLKFALTSDADNSIPELMILEKIGWIIKSSNIEILDDYTKFIPNLFTYNSRKPTFLKENTMGKKGSYTYSYILNRFEHLVFVLLYHTLAGKMLLRSCECCGRIFIAKRPNNIYCDGVDPESGKLCVKYGPHKSKQEMSEIDKLCVRIMENHRIYFSRHLKEAKERDAIKEISKDCSKMAYVKARLELKIEVEKYIKNAINHNSDKSGNEVFPKIKKALSILCNKYSSTEYIATKINEIMKESR